MSTYPLGRSATDRPPRVPRADAEVFVLGVYASALHVRWQRPDGAVMVQALAVDDEPEVFWDGADAAERIATNLASRCRLAARLGTGHVIRQRDVGSSTGGRRARPTRDIDRPVSRHRLPASLSREARAWIARPSHGEGLRPVRRGSRIATGFLASTALRSRARAAGRDGRPRLPCHPAPRVRSGHCCHRRAAGCGCPGGDPRHRPRRSARRRGLWARAGRPAGPWTPRRAASEAPGTALPAMGASPSELEGLLRPALKKRGRAPTSRRAGRMVQCARRRCRPGS